MMSAKAMQADGMPVSEVVTKQLAKIEELTLYAIALEKENQARKQDIAASKVENAELRKRLEAIEQLLVKVSK